MAEWRSGGSLLPERDTGALVWPAPRASSWDLSAISGSALTPAPISRRPRDARAAGTPLPAP